MDLVLPYVDSADKIWQEGYIKACRDDGREVNCDANRYREFIPLKYLLRTVAKNMPFISKVFLVVQSRSQVPVYIRESKHLKVVLHEEFIPQEFLPTYNSNTIELFVHRIKGLSEKFLLTNDDLLPIRRLHRRDFFTWGIPRLSVQYRKQFVTDYRMTLKNSETLIASSLGMDSIVPNNWFLRDGHTMQPQRVSVWKNIFRKCGCKIFMTITPFRNLSNCTQQLSQYWYYFKDCFLKRKFNTRYYSFIKCTIDTILEDLESTDVKIVCINDSGCTDYYSTTKKLNNWLEKRLSKKCKYEN